MGERPLKVVVSGSRGWTDTAAIERRLSELPEHSIVIHGGAEGADFITEHEARLRGLQTAVLRPLWKRYGMQAGHIRNARMLDLHPDLVIAFSLGTNGTQSMIAKARERNIPVEVIGREAKVMA